MLSAYPGIFSNMIFVAQCVQFAYAATTLPLFQRSFARRLNTRDNTFQIVVSNNCLFASKITFTLFVIISIACVHFCRPRNQAGMHLFVCLFGLLHYGAFVVWAGVFRGCLLCRHRWNDPAKTRNITRRRTAQPGEPLDCTRSRKGQFDLHIKDTFRSSLQLGQRA